MQLVSPYNSNASNCILPNVDVRAADIVIPVVVVFPEFLPPKCIKSTSKRGLSGGAVAPGAIGGGSMVHRLDFDLGLHRLAAAADGGGSGDYTKLVNIRTVTTVETISRSIR